MNIPQSINPVEMIDYSGVVAITRMDDSALILDVCGALYAGGIRCFEVPLTTEDAAQTIARLRSRLAADATVGAGTVLTSTDAENVIEGGAAFVVSPHLVPEVAAVTKAREIAFIPGAFTPAEIFRCWSVGADIVKVFPIRALGPAYLTDLLGPYPELKLMPTGGITLENAASFIKAGACAVTVGRDLIGGGPWNQATFDGIAERAQNLVRNIGRAKDR